MAGVGAVELSLRKDFKVFLWKTARGSICEDLRANDESPDNIIGDMQVLYMCNLRTGLRKHLKAKPMPKRLKRQFLLLAILNPN